MILSLYYEARTRIVKKGKLVAFMLKYFESSFTSTTEMFKFIAINYSHIDDGDKLANSLTARGYNLLELCAKYEKDLTKLIRKRIKPDGLSEAFGAITITDDFDEQFFIVACLCAAWEIITELRNCY